MQQLELQRACYVGLMESSNNGDWSKATVQFIIHNESKVKGWIGSMLRAKMTIVSKVDIDEVLSQLKMYMYKAEDYNIEKAEVNGGTISLPNYVRKCASCCVKRHNTIEYKLHKDIIVEVKKDKNGDTQDILDCIEDKKEKLKIDNIVESFEDTCRELECRRYINNVDIFQVFYINAITGGSDNGRLILKLLGVPSVDAGFEVMTRLAQASSSGGLANAIKVLEKYVYGSEVIKQALR